MKKIISIGLILIMFLCITSNVYAAISYQVSLTTSKNEFQKDEEFVVDVKIVNFQADVGIITFGAQLEYDKDNLTLMQMEGKNGWETPSKDNNTYNESNGKIVLTRSGRRNSR